MRVQFASLEQLSLADVLETIVAVVAAVLEQVLVEHLGGRKGAETIGQEEPTTFAIFLILILPSLIGQLAENLISQLFVLDALVDNVVGKDLFSRST